jgi:hypothetical protein
MASAVSAHAIARLKQQARDAESRLDAVDKARSSSGPCPEKTALRHDAMEKHTVGCRATHLRHAVDAAYHAQRAGPWSSTTDVVCDAMPGYSLNDSRAWIAGELRSRNRQVRRDPKGARAAVSEATLMHRVEMGAVCSVHGLTAGSAIQEILTQAIHAQRITECTHSTPRRGAHERKLDEQRHAYLAYLSLAHKQQQLRLACE